MPKPLEKLKYWHHELIRDVALGKPEEKILKKYKPFRLSKNLLKFLLEDPLVVEEFKRLNEEADKVIAEVKKKSAILALRALEVLEEDMNQPEFVEKKNSETGAMEKQYNPSFNRKGRREIALKLLGHASEDSKRGGTGDVHVHFSKSEPKAKEEAPKKEEKPKETTMTIEIPKYGAA